MPEVQVLLIAQASVAGASEMSMKDQLKSYAGRIAAGLQNVGASMDPEILQLPGGSVIATLLWLYVKGTLALRRH